MRARLVCLLVALASLLAGCALDPRQLAPPEPAETILPWGLAGCSFVVAVVPVPAGRLADRMPPGFRPLSPTEIGLPDDPRGDGNLGIEAWRCNDGVGHNESVELHDVPYGAVFSFVEAPEHLRDNESRFHFVKWDTLVPDEERRLLLERHGLPALNGTAEFRRFQDVAGRLLLDVGLELNGTYSFDGAAGAPAEGMDAFAFTEFTPTPHGLARWRTDVTAAQVLSGGGGFVSVPAGYARDVLGADRVQAYLLAGTGAAFENATLTLPPLPLE